MKTPLLPYDQQKGTEKEGSSSKEDKLEVDKAEARTGTKEEILSDREQR